MYSFRKSKKGFTLIELMVVVAIIGVLALLGLRLYAGQQAKAKEAIVKANAGTVQTLIQSELADGPVVDPANVAIAAGLRNPFLGEPMTTTDYFVVGAEGTLAVDNYPATDDTHEGDIYINTIESGIYFQVIGFGEDGVPIPEILTARR